MSFPFSSANPPVRGQAKHAGNPFENKEDFSLRVSRCGDRRSLPASGGAKGDQGRNDRSDLIDAAILR